uniref:hypothetical protein n=1 Tax=Streptomyces sp. WZ-12 TaxID=3030210 RepID=UPI00238109F8|nr:hypothetical protein [Streptomyces sp. WZ-12]
MSDSKLDGTDELPCGPHFGGSFLRDGLQGSDTVVEVRTALVPQGNVSQLVTKSAALVHRAQVDAAVDRASLGVPGSEDILELKILDGDAKLFELCLGVESSHTLLASNADG